MPDHPNAQLAQANWDAIARGDFEPALAGIAEDVVVENGPGAGLRHIEGRDAWVEFALAFISLFGDTWKQDGRCIYADDRITISLVQETGSIPSGDTFDNLAVYITRVGPDGETERLWTVDIDHEACEEFWQRNPRPGTWT